MSLKENVTLKYQLSADVKISDLYKTNAKRKKE
jgi:hypothetical protein